METFEKFDGIDYANTFARRISIMHELIKDVLSRQLRKMDVIIDIGGGPGMGARIIDELGVEATVINIEPSTTINDVPRLSFVKYIPLKMTFKEALHTHLPYRGSCLLMVSSEHEIALCNGRTPAENKKEFFHDLNEFIHKNLKKNGCLIIGFPNYRKGSSEKEIARQRKFTESLLGHSHPPEELFTVEEFSSGFDSHPDVFIQKPMTLADEIPEETILMANVVVFKIKNTGEF
jgi:SAM-dependent methyltransferase